MPTRRTFLQQLAGGATWVAASGLVSTRHVLGANDRIRIGLIGAGDRGKEIFRAALRCPNVEAVAVADVYTRRLNEAQSIVPGIRMHRDFRRVLDDKSVDAVLIATPQHQHALNFVPALQAGKDVYQEKTMAFNPGHARRMRKAFEGSGRVVQIGMQMNSGPGVRQVQELATPERLGTINALQAHHFRNAAYGGWLRRIPIDCDAGQVDWPAFEGEAKRYPFDPQRYMNWRFYWDYSGGNVFENMVHQLGFWFQVLGLSIPETVTMAGANYRSPKMEVPDTMTVCMNHREQVLFTWSSTFSNTFYGETHDYLFGTKGTVMHDASGEVVYLPPSRAATAGLGGESQAPAPQRPGYTDYTPQHMQNFFDCVRSRQQPVCPFDLGFRTAITCQMAIASYRRQRTVRWDPQLQDIV
ncbi:MAG: Gfo/Idh/MocA family oxidoreductase [Verrucomicrobia bacterium]|nr:Gfo/Idh/MocA family oxidoreductase [Verrucomicrobiota bacterium]